METESKFLDPELVNAKKPVWAFSRKTFCEGMRDGVPIALGYFTEEEKQEYKDMLVKIDNLAKYEVKEAKEYPL